MLCNDVLYNRRSNRPCILRVRYFIYYVISYFAFGTYTYMYIFTHICIRTLFDIMSSVFAEFRYNVTCGWFSFIGLSVFDVGCNCWLLGV